MSDIGRIPLWMVATIGGLAGSRFINAFLLRSIFRTRFVIIRQIAESEEKEALKTEVILTFVLDASFFLIAIS